MDYISRHRKLDAAKKRCEIESRKAIELRFVIQDGSWFKVVKKATEPIYTYFEQLPVCQYCKTQLAAYRLSNCETCGELKNDAARDPAAYRDLMTIFEVVRSKGLTEQAFQDEVVRLLEEATTRTEALREKNRVEEQDRKKRRKEERKQREADNRILRANGYRWVPVEIGTEESWAPGGYHAGYGEFSHNEWELYDPDGNKVERSEIPAIIQKLKNN